VVRDFVAETNGRIEIKSLPAYAPELNPVEYLWGLWKHHDLRNFCLKNLYQLSEHARKALRRMRRLDRLWLLLAENKPNCFSLTILYGTQ
jgi:hypothetical protein